MASAPKNPRRRTKAKANDKPPREHTVEENTACLDPMETKMKPLSAKQNPGHFWRVHVTIPGLLYPSVRQRWAEFAYHSFSPYAVDLVCYDLRERFPHLLTQPLSLDLQPDQDAVDARIVAHYRPGMKRDKGLILQLLNEREDTKSNEAPVATEPARSVKPQSLCSHAEHIWFTRTHRPFIRKRWRELGYDGLAPYVSGLIRYDLALGGPHRYCNGFDTDPLILAALDAETAAMFRQGKRQRIRLMDFIEEAAGRPLTDEECFAEIGKLLERLRRSARRS